MDINLSISPIKRKNKPRKGDNTTNSRISKSIVSDSMTIEELAQKITLPNGQTWAPAIYKNNVRKNSNWISQQVFAIDIDKGLTLEGFLERAKEYGIMPAFVHTTFSSVNENKFRAIYVFPVEVTDSKIRDVIQEALQRVHPESDNTQDKARMFYGGKAVVYADYEARLDLMRLIEGMVIHTQLTDSKNAARKIASYCQTVGLEMINGLPRIEAVDDDSLSKSEDSVTSFLSIERMNVMDSSHFIRFHWNRGTGRGKTAQQVASYTNDTQYETVRNVDWNRLYATCPVYRDFMDGVDVHENVSMFIATNLIWLYGGEARFYEGLRKRSVYDEEKWRKKIAYYRKSGYNAANYEKISEFYDDVEGITQARNLVMLANNERNKIKMLAAPNYITLNAAEAMLETAFREAMDADDTDIHIIKAPTGIGKTRLYETVKNATIAVPLHKLKEEVYDRMVNAGNTALVSPSLPDDLPDEIKDTADGLYAMGAITSANVYLRKAANDNPDLAIYIDEKDETSRVVGTNLITTHARLFHLGATNDTWIIDEDIIPTLFKQSLVSIKDVLYLEELTKPVGFGAKRRFSPLKNMINFVKDAEEGLAYTLPSYGLTNEDTKEIEKAIVNKSISSNVLSLLNASHFYKTDETIYYISKRTFPKDKKIIILSATANEAIYKLAFGSRVHFVDIGRVQPKGRVDQIVNVSASRTSLRDNPILIDLLNKIAGSNGVITYKELKKHFPNALPEIHFGKLVGIDEYSGIPLAIIGTPHLNPIAYLLLASALGVEVKPRDYMPLSRKTVHRNGYSFRFMTYSQNTDLQEIQLHLIEAELIQAIGRARTLRNDVRVLVVSDMPIEGAHIHYLYQDQEYVW